MRTVNLILSVMLTLTGCTTTATTALPNVESSEYQLARGDKLRMEVFREEGLSGEYTVDRQGMLNLPMLGLVPVAGTTLAQARDTLTAAYSRDHVRNARLNLSVVEFRPIYVLGEVERPGEYAYTPDMSVFALVAKAGGFTYRANQKVVFVRHTGEDAETAYRLSSGAAVQPGDTIRIEQRYF